MAYTPTTWVDGVTKLGPTNLNHLETGLQTAAAVADSATTTAGAAVPKSTVTTAADLIVGTGNAAVTRLGVGAAGQVLAVVGGVLTWVYPPGFVFSYVEFTADVTINQSAAASAVTIVTAASITFDGSTSVWVEFEAQRVETGTSSSSTTLIDVWDGATDLGILGSVVTSAAAASAAPFSRKRLVTPSAGAHVFSIRGWFGTAAGIVRAGTGGAGATLPGHIRVFKA